MSDPKIINFNATIDYSINPCGGIINVQNIVTIASPNYPKNYQNSTNCAWLIKLPEGGNVKVSIRTTEWLNFCKSNPNFNLEGACGLFTKYVNFQ